MKNLGTPKIEIYQQEKKSTFQLSGRSKHRYKKRSNRNKKTLKT